MQMVNKFAKKLLKNNFVLSLYKKYSGGAIKSV